MSKDMGTHKYVTPVTLLERLPTVESMLLFLDYDGTLAPFVDRPEQATLSAQVRVALKHISEDSRVRAVIVSGRTRQFLEREMSGLPVDLAAEHGLMFKQRGESFWKVFPEGDIVSELAKYRDLLDEYAARIPGAFVEAKEFSLVFHYRAVKETPTEILQELEYQLKARQTPAVRICPGNKILEVRGGRAGKGTFLEWYLSKFLDGKIPGLVLVIGDDTTDEDMYPVINKVTGISVKVGDGETMALYRVASTVDVTTLLENIPNVLRSD